MRLLLFEPDPTGHHLHYAQILADAIQALNANLTTTLVVSSDAPATPEFAIHLKRLPTSITLDASALPRAASPRQTAADKLRSLENAVRTHRPDHVLIPYADGLTQIAGMRRMTGMSKLGRNAEFEVLMMRGGGAYEAPRTLKGKIREQIWLSSTAAAPWTLIHHADPFARGYIAEKRPKMANRIAVIPDPVSPKRRSKSDARAKLNLPPDGRYISAAGLLNESKGTDLLIKAFVRAPLREDDRLLLVGRHNDTVRSVLKTDAASAVEARRIISIDRYVDNDEIDATIDASDIVATTYPRHIGSASFVLRAAAAERMVLGSDWGWIGRIVSGFGLGLTCNPYNAEALAADIVRAMETAPSYTPGEAARRFVEFHTPENFVKHFLARLRQRLGLPDEPRMQWQSVLSALPAGTTL